MIAKYRAWDNVKSKMYYVGEEDNIVFTFDSNGIVATDITEDDEEVKTLHHLEYMQYTGLTDRNKTPIYEGDIVKQTYHTQAGSVHDGTDITFDGHHIGQVVITARGVCLKNPLHYSIDTGETNPMNAYKQVAGYRSEVIGNVFQHSHLLKE